jgi:hypothetical protein
VTQETWKWCRFHHKEENGYQHHQAVFHFPNFNSVIKKCLRISRTTEDNKQCNTFNAITQIWFLKDFGQ